MTLPEPSAEALSHSRRLTELIHAHIRAANGWISFARYMELALYAPGLGYYSAGAAKLGSEGDFVTAPEISPYFGRTLALAALRYLPADGEMLELGAGSGRLALDLLCELGRRNALPRRYLILDVSADLRERQRVLFERNAPELLERICWLDTLPDTFSGVVLANEVLDALPAHVLRRAEGAIVERGVAVQADGFAWEERPVTLQSLQVAADGFFPGNDYVSEVSLAVPAMIASVGATLRSGAAMFIDYGFLRAEYYHAQRNRGTLMCHYRHHAHDDPFVLPGLQDITAHVDFTAVAEAAQQAGLRVASYDTQARFLINHGITELLIQLDARDAATYLPAANGVQRLLSPAEMGELFKVMVLVRE
jgi:SAM-dependent MidA family methyltransferase